MLKPGVLVRWHYLTYYVSAVQGDKADLYSHCIQRRRAGDTTGACAAPAANGSIKQKKAPAGAVPAGVFPFYPPNSSSFVSMSAGAQPQAHKRAGKNSGFHFFTGAVPRILCVRQHILLTASSTALGLTFFTKSGNVGTEIL